MKADRGFSCTNFASEAELPLKAEIILQTERITNNVGEQS